MVKIVDDYVLQRQIGRGQFGEVYKGYHKVTLKDVAVKAVNRSKLKGKFYELLENEIKVLRCCDNNNIIKLYDIKKTKNNIYLMLEYCNEGDLMEYLKKKGKLTEEEAVDIFIQILNAFKTLVKNKIMHRDFKLPNILKHNGVIKIADFGFSKILGDDAYATTMLGSPLNMAPEILGGKDYNNKADIWSIGTCFYEMLFGMPPYTAKNIVELLKLIRERPLVFPSNVKISSEVKDLLKKMLVFNPNERIDWEELFEHKVTKMLEEKILKDLENTLKNQDIQNISRFYINNNKVIDHPIDIEKHKDINEFAYGANKNKGEDFKGQVVNRKLNRNNEKCEDDIENEEDLSHRKKTTETHQHNDQVLSNDETEREKKIRIFKFNTSRILHERNKYVFLASVAEDAISLGFKYSDLIGYILIKKLFKMLCQLKVSMETQNNCFKLPIWREYVKSRDYKKIGDFIFNEYDLFENYFNNLNKNVKKKFANPSTKSEIIEELLKAKNYQEIDDILRKLLRNYIELIFDPKQISNYNKKRKDVWIHINQLLDCLNSEKVFYFDEDGKKQFNFKLFYEEVKNLELEDIKKIVSNKLNLENIKIETN
jgi:serine/threonine-protein kinase ULK/ATG1